MMKIKHLLTVFFLTVLSTFSVAQIEMIDLPPQTGSFTLWTRGFWFTSPVDATIISVRVPTTISTGPQSFVVMKFNGNNPPTSWPTQTLAYSTEIFVDSDPSMGAIPVNIPIATGEVIGIIGSRNGANSYGLPNPFTGDLFGFPLTIQRMGTQTNIAGGPWPNPVWTETAGSVGRVEVEVQMAGGGGQDQACLTNQCVTVVCPPDVTVTCIEDFTPDATAATATSACGTITAQWVTEPHQTGADNCDGTTYEYTYKAVDDTGEIGCCVQVVTIANAAPTITVIPGGTVECAADIETDPSDATVTTSCGEELPVTIYTPVITGTPNCPNTTYTYTYRVEDQCEREATADRVFTIQNAGPTITAPDDVTCECWGGVNTNAENASVDASCDLGYAASSSVVFNGTQDCPGSTAVVTYTATDDCGRTVSDNQVYTIQNGPPTIYGHDNCLIISCDDEGWEDIIQAWLNAVTAKNSCGTPVNVSNNYNPNAQGHCISNGTTTVTWFATDQCGRTSTTTNMIIIADTEPPHFIEEAQDVLDICNYNTPHDFDDWVDAHGGAIAYDGCDENITNNQWSTIPNNPSFPNCMGQMGPVSVTVTFVVRDDCGNKSSTTATYTALMAGGDLVDGGNEGAEAANEFTLNQNQPNPFSDATVISFTLPVDQSATLTIYDLSGKVVKVVQGDYAAGYNEIQLSRSELSGAGMLYYELSTANETAVKKMIIVD